MLDRKDRRLEERIVGRRFDDVEVRRFLNELEIDDLIHELGQPRIVTSYAEPLGYWSEGDGRPELADDEPSTMQLIGRCMASRVRRTKLTEAAPARLDTVHPDACPWDDHDDEQLLAALDWATWHSRYITVEILVWQNREDRHVTYEREGERTGTYTNPVWAEWFKLPSGERRRRLEQLGMRLVS